MAHDAGRESAAKIITAKNMLSAWNVLLLILAASLLFHWKSWVSLADVWYRRDVYSHGYLIAIISAGLIFKFRPVLKAENPDPQLAGLLLLTALLFVWLFMRLAGIQIVELLVLPAVVWAMCLTVLGWRLSRKLVFPFFYLYFAIPIWHSGNFVLQWLTVQVTEILVSAAGFLAYIEGNRVFLTSGTFEIADGCSGINFFIVAVALSLLYGYLYLPNIYRQVVLVVIAVMFALVMNWVRVFIIIYAGYVTDMQHYLVTVDHKTFGWVLFAFVLLPLLFIARRLEGGVDSNTRQEVAPSQMQPILLTAPKKKIIQALIAIIVVLLLASLFEAIKNTPSKSACGIIQISSGNSDWRKNNSEQSDWRPIFLGTTSELLNHYTNGESDITLYVNMYLEQYQGKELIGYENKIEGDDGWSKGQSKIREVKLDDGVIWKVREIMLQAGKSNKRVVYYWYDIAGMKTVDDLTAKLWQGLYSIIGRPYSSLIAVSTKCEQENCKIARSNLDAWLKHKWGKGEKALVYLQSDCEQQ